MTNDGFLIAKGLRERMLNFYINPDAIDWINQHLLLIGGSGQGKTYLLRSIIDYLNLIGKTVIVFDFHKDLSRPLENVVEFTVRNSPYGINLFELDMSETAGGVFEQSEIIAQTFKDYFIDGMGTKQKNILKELIIDLYAIFGIYDNDSSTWTKSVPTMKDFYELTCYIQVCIDNYDLSLYKSNFINEINKKKRQSKKNQLSDLNERLEELDTLIQGFEDLEESFNDYCNKYLNEKKDEKKEKFKNIDINKYIKKSKVKSFLSLIDYTDNIATMSIFEDKKPRIIQNSINRFDMSAFTSTNKPLVAKFASEFILQKLFRSTKNRGEYENYPGKMPGTKCDFAVVFDESKIAMPDGREKNNPYNVFNRVTTEARKYGLMLVLASQKIQHFSDDVISNIYTKIILPIDSNDYKAAGAAFNLDKDMFESTFKTKKGRPAIIGQSGKPYHSYLIEDLSV